MHVSKWSYRLGNCTRLIQLLWVVVRSPNMASEKKSGKTSSKGGKSNEEIFAGFQTLRNEQRMMANKLSEMEMELNEHKYAL